MKIYKNIEQGTKEWFEVRLLKFTASNASTILACGEGLEHLISQMLCDYYHYKQFGNFPPKFKNELMQRGNDLEDEARKVYEFETEQEVKQVGFIERSKHVGCSPDGLVSTDGLIEIKNHSDSVYRQLLFDRKINKKYIAQIQMQLYVSGRKWCDYFGYNRNFEENYVKIRIEKDIKTQELLKKSLDIAVKKLEKRKSELDKLLEDM